MCVYLVINRPIVVSTRLNKGELSQLEFILKNFEIDSGNLSDALRVLFDKVNWYSRQHKEIYQKKAEDRAEYLRTHWY